MRSRSKIIIVGVIVGFIIFSSSSLYFYLMDAPRIVYPGMGSSMWAVEDKLCKQLGGDSAIGRCFGVNDICKDVYGILKYDKSRSEVACHLDNRVSFNCTNLQLATGWEKYREFICYLPLKNDINHGDMAIDLDQSK